MNHIFRPAVIVCLLPLCLIVPLPAADRFDFQTPFGLEDVDELLKVLEGSGGVGNLFKGYIESRCDVCPEELDFESCGCRDTPPSGPVWEAPGLEETLAHTRELCEQLRAEIKRIDPAAEVRITSAYRAQDYQSHLYDIYCARRYASALGNTCPGACKNKVSEVWEACECHGICANPVARISTHSSGEAFDISKRTIGRLSECELCEVANRLGLSVLVECGAYHISVSDTPHCARKCGGPFTLIDCGTGVPRASLADIPEEEMIGDEGTEFEPPVWDLRIGPISLSTVFPSLLALRTLFPGQQLVPGETGLPSFQLADGTLRMVGSCVVDGATRYCFTDPLRLQFGSLQEFVGLTFTDRPPPNPESLRVRPSRKKLKVGQELGLKVTAKGPRGRTENLTPRAAWTFYESSTPEVASVDADGRVTARSPGAAAILVRNGAAEATVDITVAAAR